MLFRRRPDHRLPPAPAIPAGERVYAIGDVHGRLDLLLSLVAQIETDDARRAPALTTLIFVGDLIDRGPASAGVVRLVRELGVRSRFRVRLICGNHEEVLLLATRGNSRAMRNLVAIGGDATIRSYGIDDAEAAAGSFSDLARLLRQRIPRADLDLLDGAEDLITIGDYAFVHAGIRPGIPLDEQHPADLRWIRREFLDSDRDHGKVIVHGHTIAPDIEERHNRLGIDTGAFGSGRLSAIGLEASHRWHLAATDAATADAPSAIPPVVHLAQPHCL